VRGLHGLQGAVRVEVLTDRPEARFATGSVLHVEGDARPLTIVAAQPVEDGPGWRIRFREVPSRDAAERLREAYLEIEVDRAEDLEAGAAYWHEIIGATVRGSAGAVLGTVADVYRAGENEVYVVRGGPVGEFDVPAVRDVIAEFAPERREIVVDEAVLDLSSTPVDAPARTSKAPRRRHRWSRHGKGGAAGAADAGGKGGDASEPPGGQRGEGGAAGAGGGGSTPPGKAGDGA
jgi:16S rRNA processing protein RimM